MESYGEIRAALEERLKGLEQRMGLIRSDRRRERAPLDPDFQEQAVERENDQVLDALDEAGRRELAEIQVALARLEDSSYGTCRSCGNPIPITRLRVVPTTDFCIDCAQ